MGVTETKSYFKYWGKARPADGGGMPQYHLLPYHCLDVAAVGWKLLDPEKPLCRSLASQLNVDSQWLRRWFCFCLMQHDLGKFFRAFQNLVPNLSENLVQYVRQCDYVKRHDTLGFSLWLKMRGNLTEFFSPELLRVIDGWLEVVCGHHGQPPEKIRSIKSYLMPEDEEAAEAFVRDLATWALPDLSPLAGIEKAAFKRVSWQLAGVAVLADWLGSDQAIFQYCDKPQPLRAYWQKLALPNAEKVVSRAQLGERKINPFHSITQQFEFIRKATDATPLQQYAQSVELGQTRQLFILEDVTGAGKTEAAMVLVHRLMAAGHAKGVYVGLPTMATANAMYERMGKSYQALYAEDEYPSLVLAHGARDLSSAFNSSVRLSEQAPDKNYGQEDTTASAYCNQWLADNRKKALLADVGVGTIDQALLGVLPARHQSLRLLGLADKVLLVDEVHAFDPYMRQLLAALLQAHAAQGGCAILLSATLPFSFRTELVNAFAKGSQLANNPARPITLNKKEAYPLVTQWSDDRLLETPVATRSSVQRRVTVERLGDSCEAMAVVRQAVEQGQCICWIRNTVKDARQSYQLIAEQPWISQEKLTLFHSRYAMIDRQAIEQDVLSRFGKDSTGAQRSGQVLIATQVVEQSLDLDFDVMISDLAPVDLLIQRAGRLQRHTRLVSGDRTLNDSTERRPKPCLYLLAPDPEKVTDKYWLKALLPGTQAVYAHVGQLWLTLKVLLQDHGFTMPDNARGLIEGVYGEKVQTGIPEMLEEESSKAEGKDKSKTDMGMFNQLKLGQGYTRDSGGQIDSWCEDVKVKTRLSEEDNVTVVLVKEDTGALVPYCEDQDINRAWMLSSLNLSEKEWKKVGSLIPKNMTDPVERLKKRYHVLKWKEIFPLTSETAILYDRETGWAGEKKRMNDELD